MNFLEEAKVSTEVEAQPQVQTFLDMDRVEKDVAINPNNLEDSLYSVAAIYNRYAHLVAKARIQRDGFKSRVKLMEAKVEKAIRAKAIEEGEKLTNPQVASLVGTDSRVVAAELALNEAAAILTACQETLSAISMKRDMLVQLNKNQSREWEASSSRVGRGEDPPPKPEVGKVPEKFDLSDVGIE